MPASIVTFGEIMLRLTPIKPYERLTRSNALEKDFAGAESNVAIALRQLQHDAYFVTKLPENALGDSALNNLREFGVNTEFIARGGKRMGIYFIEQGASIRPSKVIYDRDGSSFQEMISKDFNWEKILKGKNWLHLSGITPALSPSCADSTMAIAKKARSMGLTVSFDMNFRRKMWQDTASARKIFEAIFKNTDILIANTGAARDVFNLGEKPEEDLEFIMRYLHGHYGFNCVCFTERSQISASETHWSGHIFDGKTMVKGDDYHLNIIDRFGGGDAFAAGIIHGFSCGWKIKKSLNFAIAASALKHTVPGDLNLFTESEILNIVAGHKFGYVDR